MVFVGKAPDVKAETNFTYLISGMDVVGNYLNATLIITVFPNHICSVLIEQVNITCTRDSFCSYTVL